MKTTPVNLARSAPRLVVLASMVISIPAWGQDLVDSDWLSKHLADRNLVVLHVGEADGYAKAHIPGSRNLALADVTKGADFSAKGLLFELPSAAELRSKFESLGVSDNARIILYAGTEQPLPAVTRVALVLNHIGLGAHTSLLNGGLRAWTKIGQTTTAEVPSFSPGRITPTPDKADIVDADFVKSIPNKPGYKLIDARAAANYKGIEPSFGKAGHIPGAISIPFNEMNDDVQQFNRDRIGLAFQAAGVKPGDKLVVYCHVGMQATEVIFGARLLGYDAVLYDGSFQDWAINNRGPVEK